MEDICVKSETADSPELICGKQCITAGVLLDVTEGECNWGDDVSTTNGKGLFIVR